MRRAAHNNERTRHARTWLMRSSVLAAGVARAFRATPRSAAGNPRRRRCFFKEEVSCDAQASAAAA